MADIIKKKILLGITGSIAAYKSATLIRLLIKNNFEVKCIMTEAAAKFISPLTVSTLSKNKVSINFFEDDVWDNHVELGLWADLFIIAPLSANSLAKLANGLADNMLCTTYLSAKCPVWVAPAMDLDMWKHQATQENISKLNSFKNKIIPVTHGELASGLVGEGRMAEPEAIMELVHSYFKSKNDLLGKKILITAGPTYEHLDPVRFIGNYSSGKMGIAIADEAYERGADVVLVLGPGVSISAKPYKIKKIISSNELYNVCSEIHPTVDISIFAAAVADYKPKRIEDQKIKKNEPVFNLELEKSIDIASELGQKKSISQIHIGFALETQNEIENSIKKIHKKNLDFIVLNSLNDKGAGFKSDTNKISIINKNGEIKPFELKLKTEVAKDIIDELVLYINK